MSIFSKKFRDKKENIELEKVSQVKPLEADLSKILSSIYPYFKQFMPSTGESEELPKNFEEIDKSKVYHHPSFKPIVKNICEDLNYLYAIDKDYSYEIIQEDKLLELNITEEELHEIALTNFRQLLSTNLKAQGDKNGLMFMVNGNLEAGLVLIDEIWDQVENQIGEQIVIAVPSRDVIVATGKSNRRMIESFNERAKIILNSGDHPLSRNWFVRNNKKWELFEAIK
jgi:hypothetical protein